MKRGKAGGCISIFVSIVLVLLSIVFIFITSGPVFGRIKYGIKDIYDFQPDEIQTNRYASMKPVRVYDCFFATYSTDSDTGETTVNNYYYAVQFKDKETLIVKTRPGTKFEYIMDSMLDDISGDPSLGTIEGVFKSLNYNVMEEYNDWFENYAGIYGELPADTQVCGYILDCSHTFTATLIFFIAACVVLMLVVVLWIVFIVTAAKGGKNNILPPTPGMSFIPEQTNSTPTQGSTIPVNSTMPNAYGRTDAVNSADIRIGDLKSYNPYDRNI